MTPRSSMQRGILMNENEIEQGIATLETLKAHIENLQKQVEALELSVQEHKNAIETMEHYKDLDNDEILIPIGAGVFIGAKISSKKALITIGNNYFTELGNDAIIEKLKARMEDMEQLKNKLITDMYKLQENYAMLSAKVEEGYRKYIEERQNVQAP